MTVAVFYKHKHSYLEGSLAAIARPFSKTTSVSPPAGPMTSPAMGFCLGLSDQTGIPSYGTGINSNQEVAVDTPIPQQMGHYCTSEFNLTDQSVLLRVRSTGQ